MITVAFYSYKGGVGRTLALANLGSYLTQLGARVFMIDFDLEAPGLPYKFDQPNDTIRASGGGLTRILAELSRGKSFDSNSLQDCVIDLGARPQRRPGIDQPEDGIDDASRGGLWILPAGDHLDQEYWSDLSEINWGRLFGTTNGAGVGAMGEMKAAIQNNYRPDFLLIDSRTGITASGGVATTLLADIVVTMLISNREHQEGTRLVIRSLLDEQNADVGDGQTNLAVRPKIVPVISRFAKIGPVGSRIIPAIDNQSNEEKVIEEANTFFTHGSPSSAHSLLSPTFVLHADSQMQRRERLLFGPGQAVEAQESSKLQSDYLRLFSAIVPRATMAQFVEPVRKRARQQLMDEPDEALGALRDLASIVASADVLQDLAKMYIVRRDEAELLATVGRLYEVHRIIWAREEVTEALSEALGEFSPYRSTEYGDRISINFVEEYWSRLSAPSPALTIAVAAFMISRGRSEAGISQILTLCGSGTVDREITAAQAISLLANGDASQEQASAVVAKDVLSASSSVELLSASVTAVRYSSDRDLARLVASCREFYRLPNIDQLLVHQVGDNIDAARELSLQSLLAMDRSALQRESEAMRFWAVIRNDSRWTARLQESRFDAFEILSRRSIDEDRYPYA